jgi:hypothetical protein
LNFTINPAVKMLHDETDNWIERTNVQFSLKSELLDVPKGFAKNFNDGLPFINDSKEKMKIPKSILVNLKFILPYR